MQPRELSEAAGAERDLGALDGPVMVFGGPYSNLEATRAALEAAGARGIPAERVICTGDVLAYCADPQATMEAVRRAGIHVVMGNCEEALAQGAADCGCGFAADSGCARLSEAWYAYADRHLPAEARRWMGRLPRRIRFGLGGRSFAVVHGAASSINRFIFPSTPAEEKLHEIDVAGTEAVLCGHSGLPFTQVLTGRLWHNAGAVGLPANDGTPRGWYSVLTVEGDHVAIERRPLSYDHASAARKMRERGLPTGYSEALVSGLWPSCDVLPPAELALRGEPLAAERTVYASPPRARSA